jgi:hypothetical protein
LVFCGANPNHLGHLRVLLLFFKADSSLKVNLGKSVLVPIGNVDNMGELTGILGCGTSSLPLKYLGILLGASYKEKCIWEVMWKRWSVGWPNWKRMYLSKGGRVTLIKSTLSNLPTYFVPLPPSLLVW